MNVWRGNEIRRGNGGGASQRRVGLYAVAAAVAPFGASTECLKWNERRVRVTRNHSVQLLRGRWSDLLIFSTVTEIKDGCFLVGPDAVPLQGLLRIVCRLAKKIDNVAVGHIDCVRIFRDENKKGEFGCYASCTCEWRTCFSLSHLFGNRIMIIDWVPCTSSTCIFTREAGPLRNNGYVITALKELTTKFDNAAETQFSCLYKYMYSQLTFWIAFFALKRVFDSILWSCGELEKLFFA